MLEHLRSFSIVRMAKVFGGFCRKLLDTLASLVAKSTLKTDSHV